MSTENIAVETEETEIATETATNATEAKKTRLDSEAIDKLIASNVGDKSFKDICSLEIREEKFKAYVKRFNDAWNGKVDCANIAIINGVSTTSVVSYINNDIVTRTENLVETIKGIGNGKPKASIEDKLRKLGLSEAQIAAIKTAK